VVGDGESVYGAQAFTPADALLPRERPPAIVRNLLQRGSLNMFFSSPGSLKTLILLDLAFCVSQGHRWLVGLRDSSAGFEVSQCPVLWVDQDNGRDLMLERIEAITRAYGASEGPLHCLSFPQPGIAAARGLSLLTRYALELGAGLVVLDNLLRIAGVRDENAAEIDMAMSNLRQFAEDTGAAVVLVHHRRKDPSGREGDSIRGHSSIEAALDNAYLVIREEKSDFVNVKCTKARRRPAPPYSALWTYEHKADGETLHTARFWGTPQRDMKAEALEGLKVDLLATLRDGALNVGQAAEAVGRKKADVSSALRELHMARQLKLEIRARNAHFYSLPE
jgi:hypothetical protein